MREPERRIRRNLKSTRTVAARLRWTFCRRHLVMAHKVDAELKTAYMNPSIGTYFTFKVKHSAQGASGGSYYVRFDVEATLSPADEFDVAFEDIYPNDPAPSDLDAAKSAITIGFRDALTSCGLGAKIVVTQLTLHPVDFNPGKYGYWACYHLTQQLAAAGISGAQT